jgi:hypothetical protein
MFEIANFFQRDKVGVELRQISVDGADLPVLLGARSVRATAGELLHVPERDRDVGGR